MEHLETVLSGLKKEDLYVSPKKFSFLQPEKELLGMLVSKDEVRVNPDKGQVVPDWRQPVSLTEVHTFMDFL